MANEKLIKQVQTDAQELFGIRPQTKVLHLIDKGGKKGAPVFETSEGIRGYTGRHLFGNFNADTNNASFPGSAFADTAKRVFDVSGFEAVDITELALQKLGIDPGLAGVVNPEALTSVKITEEEVKAFIQQKTGRK